MADDLKLVVGADGIAQLVPLSKADLAQREIDEAAYQASLSVERPPTLADQVAELQSRLDSVETAQAEAVSPRTPEQKGTPT